MPQFVRKRWESKFGRFIRSYGVEPLALELDVTSPAIYHWIRGASIPRPAYAEVIQRLARDRGFMLTMDDIYGHRRNVRTEDPKVATTRWRSKLQRLAMKRGSRLTMDEICAARLAGIRIPRTAVLAEPPSRATATAN
jgi:hypothetical protein